MRREEISERSLPVTVGSPDAGGQPAAAESLRRRIKKLPPEQRRRRIVVPPSASWGERVWIRLRNDPQFVRSTVQAAFALLCIWIGVEFWMFMRWGLSDGATTYVQRPPGAEGFLPISALISLKYWLATGVVNEIHPSGLIILLAIIAVSVLLKKAFCSWLCPIGTLSESLWLLGKKMFGRTFEPPRWLDLPLRGLKYLLLVFFAATILTMDVPGLRAFIYSPYNKVADVKMFLFFADLTAAAFWTIMALVVGSIFIKGFWCRYVCPYGALLGAASWLSPLKITRNAATCIDCELCTKACPARIPVHTVTRVRSDECMSCYRCVDVCPVKDTLAMQLTKRSKPIPGWVFGVLVAGVFMAVTGLGILTGHWQNAIPQAEYLHRIQTINAPVYQHFRGHVPAYGPND